MLNFLLSCSFHFIIGVFLYLSLRGIEKITQKIINSESKIFYSSNIVIYFLIAYLIFNFNKNILIFFSILFALYFLITQKKNLIDFNFLSLLIGILGFSFYIGKIIHGPLPEISAWGLFDTYFYVSAIYQDNIEIFKVNNNNIYGLYSSIFSNIIAFLGNQFSFYEKFDGFYFISISLFTFSILNLTSEISKLNYFHNKNILIVSISIICFIFALPYPLYFFESPSTLLVIPIFPQILSLIYEKKINKVFKFLFIPFALIISKTAVLSVYFLALLFSLRKNIFQIIILIFIFVLFTFSLNLIIPISFYFENLNIELFEISQNFAGLHKIFHIILIISLLFFLKQKTFYFFYVPSVIIYILFPQASPAQLFYLFFFISLLILLYNDEFIKFPSLKIKLLDLFLISLIASCSFLSGYIIKVDFYLYFIYFFIFLLSFRVLRKKEIIFINLFFLIFLFNSLINTNYREDNVLNINQKKVYLKVKQNTPKNSLIFSDLNLSETSINPPWGLYSSISERQFYLSSFYSDYTNKFSEYDKIKMNEVNFEIIKNNKLPSSYLNDSRFKEFYILTHKSNPSNINADIIFQTEDFKLLKFK